jgi:hypothetical protein
MPLKKITFSMTIDAPQLFAALTQMGADVEVGFNGEPPRAKKHRVSKSDGAPQLIAPNKPLMITDQSKQPKTRDVVLRTVRGLAEPATAGAICVIVKKVLPNKTDAAIYQHLKLLRQAGMVVSKNKLYQITAKGAK